MPVRLLFLGAWRPWLLNQKSEMSSKQYTEKSSKKPSRDFMNEGLLLNQADVSVQDTPMTHKTIHTNTPQRQQQRSV